jgi:hypothetical protein
MLKMDSLTLSVVGRVPVPGTALSGLPLQIPETTLIILTTFYDKFLLLSYPNILEKASQYLNPFAFISMMKRTYHFVPWVEDIHSFYKSFTS